MASVDDQEIDVGSVMLLPVLNYPSASTLFSSFYFWFSVIINI